MNNLTASIIGGDRIVDDMMNPIFMWTILILILIIFSLMMLFIGHQVANRIYSVYRSQYLQAELQAKMFNVV